MMPEEKYIQLAKMSKIDFVEYMNQMTSRDHGQRISQKTTVTQVFNRLKTVARSSFFGDSVLIMIVLCVFSCLMYGFSERSVNEVNRSVFLMMGILYLIIAVCLILQDISVKRGVNQKNHAHSNTIDVLNNSQWQPIRENKLNVGKVFRLKAGDDVPVDARIILSKNLYVSQNNITGNPNPIFKSSMLTSELTEGTSVTDYQTLLFSGSRIITGEVEAIVIAPLESSFVMSGFQILKQPHYQTNIEMSIKKFFIETLGISAILIMVFGIKNGDWLTAVINSVSIWIVSWPFLALFFYQQFLYFKAKTWEGNHGIQFNQINNIEKTGEMQTLILDDFPKAESTHLDLVGSYNLSGEVSEQISHYAFVQSLLYTGSQTAYDQAILNQLNHQLLPDEYHLLNERPSMIQPRSHRSITFEDAYFSQYTIHIGEMESIEEHFVHASSSCDEKKHESTQLSSLKEQINILKENGYLVLALAIQKGNPFDVSSDEANLLLGYLVFEENNAETIEEELSLSDGNNLSTISFSDRSYSEKYDEIRSFGSENSPIGYFSWSNPFVVLRQELDLMMGLAFSWFDQYYQYDVSLMNPSLKTLAKTIKLSKYSIENVKSYFFKVVSYQLSMMLTILLIHISIPGLSLTLTQLFLLNMVISFIFLPVLILDNTHLASTIDENDRKNSLFTSVLLNVFGNIILLIMMLVLFSLQEAFPLSYLSNIKTQGTFSFEKIHTVWFVFVVGSQWSVAISTIIKKTSKRSIYQIVGWGTLLVGVFFVVMMHPIVRETLAFHFMTPLDWIFVVIGVVIYSIIYRVINN